MSARVDGKLAKGSRKLAGENRLPYHRYVTVHTCEVCSAKVHELRRGRCWGCYARWVDARPVGIGARCVTCSEKRRRVLKAVELYGGWKPMCFNCSGQLLHIVPLPATMAELRVVVSRERRNTDRRVGKADTRVFVYERRVGDRRSVRGDYPQIDDDMIIEVTIEAASDDAVDVDFDDLTQIRELVMSLRPSEEAAQDRAGSLPAELAG